VPAGLSDTTWKWKVNVPGRILAIAGHVHDSGTNIYAVDETTRQVLCNSVASYEKKGPYVDMDGMSHVARMSGCLGNPVATINRGDQVTLHAVYHSPTAQDGVMGIMLGYVAPPATHRLGLLHFLQVLVP
jgi:hypothetical protein